LNPFAGIGESTSLGWEASTLLNPLPGGGIMNPGVNAQLDAMPVASIANLQSLAVQNFQVSKTLEMMNMLNFIQTMLALFATLAQAGQSSGSSAGPAPGGVGDSTGATGSAGSTAGKSATAGEPAKIEGGQTMGTARGTGYYPDNSAMEGGYNDMKGNKLNTLQDFLQGKAPYVSIALDKNLYAQGKVKYGDVLRIPELERKYGKVILFKAVDTGGAFTNKGFSRVDICTGSAKDSQDPIVNGNLTLIKVG
jgi:hypothetical protein